MDNIERQGLMDTFGDSAESHYIVKRWCREIKRDKVDKKMECPQLPPLKIMLKKS